MNKKYLKPEHGKLVISDSVTHIEAWAFYYSQLTSVEIPNSVTRIGNWAFENNQLTSVVIPDSVTYIGGGAFAYNQLTNVEIPNSVTYIGSWAFENNQLTSVVISDSVTYIGGGAFDDSVIINNGTIKMIDNMATTIINTKTIGDFEVSEGEFFNSKRKCYVAKKGDVTAHGDTLKEAIEDVNFKYLQKNHNVDDIVNEIKSTNEISLVQFRLLTGACSAGCKNFMKENNITDTTLPLDKAIVLLKGQYGWDRIKEYFL